jgi:uncharacterized protein (TIGR02996 family)
MRKVPGFEQEMFLAAIHAKPDGLTPRLIYADWLVESGHTDGELVRLLCEAQQSGYARRGAPSGGVSSLSARRDSG